MRSGKSKVKVNSEDGYLKYFFLYDNKEKIMKKIMIVLSMLTILLTVMSISQVNASSDLGVTAKKTPGAQATAKALDQQNTVHGNSLNNNGKSEKTGKSVNFKGEIVSVDATTLVISLKDDSLVTLLVTEDTIVKIPGKKTDTSDTLAGLLVGMKVTVKATVVPGVDELTTTITAQRITVIPGKPTKTSHVGTVSALVPGVSIEITTKKGEIFTYLLTENTKYLPAERELELAVGSVVTIISPRDVTGQPAVAAGVVIHPAGTVLSETETETEGD